jgi:ATP-dependent Lhr-like helicase
LVKGHIEHIQQQAENKEAVQPSAMDAVAQNLFKTLRGSNNLVLPNSRAKVEQYTYQLRKLCEAARVPNEFWPHHGSLSREIREEAEQALRSNERCATAICTNTLELGIDIGAVKSIAQIGPPPSVASLRQRLGRSGRRKGEPAILRGYAVEEQLEAKSHVMTQLREQLFELCAMVTLLLDGWFEPPRTGGMHLSTLVQQLLSLIAQRGGVMATAAFKLLCSSGPFVNVSKSDFVELLRSLGTNELIQQDLSGLLLHGAKGEVLVNHYTFYASFTSEEEFRIVAGNMTLGSLPISSAVAVGELILFAGRTWLIEDINEDSKTIYVVQHRAGRPPSFSSSGGQVHSRVRRRMRELYASREPLRFLDPVAAQLLSQGQETYRRHRLEEQMLVKTGSTLLLFTWLGDAENESIAAALRTRGFSCMPVGPAIEVSGPFAEENRLLDGLREFAEQPAPTPELLLAGAQNMAVEKWDWALPSTQLMRNYASHRLDIPNAWKWLAQFAA